jgi:hypothetical protein
VSHHDRNFFTPPSSGSDPGVRPLFDPASRARLTAHDLDRFPGQSLFARLGRAVCRARCIPRKELFEAWEVARRLRRHFRGGRIVDLAGGHGLLAQTLLLLDDSSPDALIVDRSIPRSATTLHEVLVETWPRLTGRARFIAADLGSVSITDRDLVVSSHACGALTDAVLGLAADARARVAVLPCCHDLQACDAGGLAGWLDPALAIDVMRATRLEARGYAVRTLTIPNTITPMNRLLLGTPRLSHPTGSTAGTSN